MSQHQRWLRCRTVSGSITHFHYVIVQSGESIVHPGRHEPWTGWDSFFSIDSSILTLRGDQSVVH